MTAVMPSRLCAQCQYTAGAPVCEGSGGGGGGGAMSSAALLSSLCAVIGAPSCCGGAPQVPAAARSTQSCRATRDASDTSMLSLDWRRRRACSMAHELGCNGPAERWPRHQYLEPLPRSVGSIHPHGAGCLGAAVHAMQARQAVALEEGVPAAAHRPIGCGCAGQHATQQQALQ